MSAGEWLRRARGRQRLPGLPSMRPRHVCRGMATSPSSTARPGGASMRPRHVCRGMEPLMRPRPPGGGGFNEAPACLPGNGAQVTSEHRDRRAASMRPRHVCRGMAAHTQVTCPGAQHASMRPRHVCRGMFAVKPYHPRPRIGFNEAPACLPGNGARLPAPRHRCRPASMRPRHVCRGMGRTARVSRAPCARASMRPRHVCRGMGFGPCAPRSRRPRASMRPRHVCRGMGRRAGRNDTPARAASMRPRHVCRGMASGRSGR